MAVYTSYTARDQLWRQWGDGAMPVEYGYDSVFGDKTTMKTFRGGVGPEGISGPDIPTEAAVTDPAWNQGSWPDNPGSPDVTRWTYDAPSGLLTAKTDAANRSVTYAYNERGQLRTREWARRVDPTNNNSARVRTDYAYHSATGELSSQIYNDGTPGVSFPSYNRLGQNTEVVQSYTGSSVRSLLDYCLCGKLSGEYFDPTFFGGRSLAHMMEQGATSVKGRATGYVLTAGSTVEQTTGYGYEPASGRFVTLSTSSQISSSNRTFRYGYLANSPLLESLAIDQGAGPGGHPFTISRSYDPKRDLLTAIQTRWGSGAGNLLAGYNYTYDERCQRTSVVQSGTTIEAEYGDVVSQHFVYDGLGQLTNALTYLGADITNADRQMPGRRHEYGYDGAGNRRSSNRTGVATLQDNYTANGLNQYISRENNTVPVSGTASPGANVAVQGGSLAPIAAARHGRFWSDEIAVANSVAPGNFVPWRGTLSVFAAIPGSPDRIKSATVTAQIAAGLQNFSYDEDGNLTSDGVWTYTWDAENRLRAMTPAPAALLAEMPNRRLEFSYDHLHRRVEKRWLVPSGSNWVIDNSKLPRRYLYSGWNLIAEYELYCDLPYP